MSSLSNIPLTFDVAAFSVNPTWTVEEFHQNMAASLSASTTSSNVILGSVGASTPPNNSGPWMKDGATWWAWNGSAYVPATVKVGGATFQVTLASAPTDNRTLTFPDKSGVIATLDDITGGRATVTLSGGSPNVDWSASNSFALPLSISATVTMTNSLPGQQIRMAVYNPAAWTVTFPPSVHFSGGTPPALPINTTNLYTFDNVAGQIYAKATTGY